MGKQKPNWLYLDVAFVSMELRRPKRDLGKEQPTLAMLSESYPEYEQDSTILHLAWEPTAFDGFHNDDGGFCAAAAAAAVGNLGKILKPKWNDRT